MIFMPRPFVNNKGCIKFVNGNKEVSIACDDSCGAFEDLSRSDIRCFNNNSDVTDEVFQCELLEVVRAELDNFQLAWNWLRQ